MRPEWWPAVETQLGCEGRWADTTMIHEPSDSYWTSAPLMVTRS